MSLFFNTDYAALRYYYVKGEGGVLMASSKEFVEYVCDQISGAGNIRYRMMMGDYCIYCDEKVIGLICDNTFFLKITKEAESILSNCHKGPAYEGAKLSYIIENLEDREFLTKIVALTCKNLPMPKPKKKKEKNK